MLPHKLSTDIIKYLQEKKGMSIDDIAEAMESTDEHIQQIIKKKANLTANDLKSYLNNTHTPFWKFATEGNLLEQLPPKIKNNVIICQQLSKSIKKKKQK